MWTIWRTNINGKILGIWRTNIKHKMVESIRSDNLYRASWLYVADLTDWPGQEEELPSIGDTSNKSFWHLPFSHLPFDQLVYTFLVLFSRAWVTRLTDDLTISLTFIQLGWLIGLTGRHRFEHKWDKTLNSFELTPCLKFVYDIWQDFTWFDTYGQSLLEDRPWRGSYTSRGGGL